MTQTRPKPAFIQNLIFHISICSIMKNAALGLMAFLFISSLSLVSCKKEATLQDRLVGNWVSSKVQSNGIDYSAIVKFKLDLQNSKEFDLDVTTNLPPAGSSTQSYNGDWTEDETKQDLILTFSNNSNPSTYEISDLTNLVMAAEIIYEGTRYQVSFDRQ